MANIRIERLNHTYMEEISMILQEEIKDEDIKFVTVTKVSVTNDLSFAKVYVTVFDEEKKGTTMKALNDASGYIRKLLAERINIRHTPELKFLYDDSIEYGNRIEEKIKEINKENKA